MNKNDIPITILDESETWLRPPGHPGSLMDRLVAAGTHKIVRPRPGVVMVVPITIPAREAINVIKRRRNDT